MSEPDMSSEPQTQRAPRWMKVTLVISLAVNLLVIGAVIGAGLSHGGKQSPRKHEARGEGVNMITDALPKEERRALGKEVRRALRADPQIRDTLRAEIEALASLMRSPDFSVGALEAQLTVIQSGMMGPISIAREHLTDRLASFDENARAEYATRLEGMLKNLRP